MENKKTQLSLLLFLVLGLATANAQEASVASGGDATGSGGTVNYSIGQIAYTTNFSATGSVAQGVQQAYEISIVTSIREAGNINLNLSAYPNPTSNFLTLNVGDTKMENLSYQLYDVSGKILEEKKIASADVSISMLHLSNAAYFLKVLSNNKEIKSFKIIKNQ